MLTNIGITKLVFSLTPRLRITLVLGGVTLLSSLLSRRLLQLVKVLSTLAWVVRLLVRRLVGSGMGLVGVLGRQRQVRLAMRLTKFIRLRPR